MVRSLMVNEISAMVVCDHEKKGMVNWYQHMQQQCAGRRCLLPHLASLRAPLCPTVLRVCLGLFATPHTGMG